jgi:hypothetical protein
MDKITPKSPGLERIPSPSTSVDERKKADRSPNPHRVAAQFLRDEPQLPVKPRVEAKKVTAGKPLTPGEARSLDALKAQAIAPLPQSLGEVPPYQHIWISHQFDAFYTPVYKDLDRRVEADLNFDATQANIPCEPLGRRLIFGGFALARDFITSKEILAKEAFKDREGLAMAVLEKLYAFTLAKMEAVTFNLQDFVHVNLLMALLIDWRKGALSEFSVSTRQSKFSPPIANAVNAKNEKENILNLKNIFLSLDRDLDRLNLNGQTSLFDCIRKDLFFINEWTFGPNYNFLSSEDLDFIPMAFTDKDSRVMQSIDSDLYKKIPLKASPFFAYTDKRSGIGEERYVKAFFDCPKALITVFNPHAGHFGPKDSDWKNSDHPSSRFSKKPTGGGYLYEPHTSRLSTLTEIDHDYRHMELRGEFMADFKKAFGFGFEEVMKPVNALLKKGNLSASEKKILAKLNFFLIHEVSTFKPIQGKTTGWKDFFLDEDFNRNATPKEALGKMVEQSKKHLMDYYSFRVGTEGYLRIYRDMELMLHEEVEFCPKDSNEKQFTYKPLRDKEGNPLLPSFQELYEGVFSNFQEAIMEHEGDGVPVRQQIQKAKTLREKWKALPKGIRNEAKTAALADGYKRFFDMAWEIIDTHISEADFKVSGNQ